MNIWHVELELHYENDAMDIWDNTAEYTVAAKDYDSALAKAIKLALKESWTDDDPDDKDATGKTYRVDTARILSIKRGLKIDS